MKETEHHLEQELVPAESGQLSFPIPSQDEVGWLLVAGGFVGAVVTLLRRRRGLADWLLPASLVGLGSGLLLRRRRTGMKAAREAIRAELDALDPLARAQVLKAVAEEQLGRLS